MKKFTYLLVVLFVAFIGKANAQATFTDDFSSGHDYLTGGVEGTIWDGVLVNDNGWDTEDEAVILELNTNTQSGALTFADSLSSWAWGADNGAMIYKTVTADADFSAQVKIVGGDYPSFGADQVNYLMSGLIARIPGDTTFVLTQAFDIPGWSAVWGVRDIVPAEDLVQENWVYMDEETFDDLSIAGYPYCKLTKTGTVFTGYYSADGENWVEIYSVDKPAFAGKEIQVGLYVATYTGSIGTVVFDDFKLYDSKASSVSAKSINNSDVMKAFYSNKNIVIKSTSAISNINVYNIGGALVSTVNNVNAKSYSIPVEKDGVYLVVSECNGKRYAQKIVAY